MSVRVARFEQLAGIIGPRLTECVCALLHGKRITIGKKACCARAEYARRRRQYDRMKAKQAAKTIGCTVRYYLALRASARLLDVRNDP